MKNEVQNKCNTMLQFHEKFFNKIYFFREIATPHK